MLVYNNKLIVLGAIDYKSYLQFRMLEMYNERIIQITLILDFTKKIFHKLIVNYYSNCQNNSNEVLE